jgi:hypothetical protein
MRNRTMLLGVLLAAVAAAVTAAGTAAGITGKAATPPVNVQVFSPSSGDAVGKASRGFFVDLAVQYPSLAASGADLQLTGPTTHQNQAPFPGAFSPGVDEKLPGLIVLLSTSTVGARNAQNLANLFNLTGFTNRKTNEIWDTWIVGAPSFGKNVRSVLRVAVAADRERRRDLQRRARGRPRPQPRRPDQRRRREGVRGRLEHRRRPVPDHGLNASHHGPGTPSRGHSPISADGASGRLGEGPRELAT